MKHFALWMAIAACVSFVSPAHAQSDLKALYVTGGCCHDYKSQTGILAKAFKTHVKAKVAWTTVEFGDKGQGIKEVLGKPGWIKPYHVVIYNFCDAHQTDKGYIDSVVAAHKESGTGAVMIHCSMHSYHWKLGKDRKNPEGKQWVKLVGVLSTGHGKKEQILVRTEADAAKHPVMHGIPAEWKTPKGELYYSNVILPSTKVLARGSAFGQTHASVWVNQCGKAKVFATTLGHHNETMSDPNWQRLVTQGTLWTMDKMPLLKKSGQ